MIVFVCSPISGGLKLSEEHTDASWLSLEEALQLLHPAFHKDVSTFREISLGEDS